MTVTLRTAQRQRRAGVRIFYATSLRGLQMKRWTGGSSLCVLLVASKASATYVVIENITPKAPNWGDCNCHQATGWLGFLTLSLSCNLRGLPASTIVAAHRRLLVK
jgi:hypothetical protein